MDFNKIVEVYHSGDDTEWSKAILPFSPLSSFDVKMYQADRIYASIIGDHWKVMLLIRIWFELNHYEYITVFMGVYCEPEIAMIFQLYNPDFEYKIWTMEGKA